RAAAADPAGGAVFRPSRLGRSCSAWHPGPGQAQRPRPLRFSPADHSHRQRRRAPGRGAGRPTLNLYADSSAVLSWIFGEPRGQAVRKVLAAADSVLASDLTLVECDRTI